MQSKQFRKTLLRSYPEKPTKQNRPELLAPAGSFSTAYHAIQAGADAVYFGLKDFSARKGAPNFTMEEVAQLKGFAESQGKRIYAALNTVIRDSEIPAVASALYDLESLEVDGVIIQDLGVLYLLHHWFPRLSIHASTQMTVHTSAGIEPLKKLGVRRFVLSRELTLEELQRIRKRHPDVELEVFIHGALCYSVSGLCLASGVLLGRSGNRGECAQICRSWFTMEPSNRTRTSAAQANKGGAESLDGYFFSCKDLALGEEVLRLQEIGIDAFKIEGRLKSPEWVAAVTSYYRSLLDRLGSSHPEDSQVPAESRKSSDPFERACWIFSRSLTQGYLWRGAEDRRTIPSNPKHAYPFNSKKAPFQKAFNRRLETAGYQGFSGLLDPRFPGHRGIPIGKVLAVEGKYFLLKPNRGLSVRDGLQFFRPLSGIRMEAVPFGIERILSAPSPKHGPKEGKPILSCQSGQLVWIKAPEPPSIRSEIFLISTHSDALPEAPRNVPQKKIPLELWIEIQEASEASQENPKKEAWLTIHLKVVNQKRHPSPIGESLYIWKGVVPIEKARSGLGAEEVCKKYLSPPGDSCFRLTQVSVNICTSDLLAHNSRNHPRSFGIFIPPSKLKQIRREVYRKATDAWIQKKEAYIEEILRDESPHEIQADRMEILPPRDRLYTSSSGIPFVTEDDLSNPALFSNTSGIFLPLPPV
ncbi:MAG: U32 family peptidase, partial [Spirochaetes bacterium]|nr:U32 family peptidase [Spirochaetota bacterium]